ncbi:MAG: hypothetical protein SFU21_10225 [Flavihumibacter sp.]|nr:hypothetical protein [Flavihumibacter sp.]
MKRNINLIVLAGEIAIIVVLHTVKIKSAEKSTPEKADYAKEASVKPADVRSKYTLVSLK